MSQQQKDIFNRYLDEIWNKGDLSNVEEMLTSNFVQHAPGRDIEGLEAFKQYVTVFRTGFPDLYFRVEEQFEGEGKIVTHWTATGTHKGELMGIPATNKQIILPGVAITRFTGNKLSDNLLYWDRLGLFQQLGVTPK